MITLNNINYKYPKKTAFALEDISFEIKPGEIFTLLGPNGAGSYVYIHLINENNREK